MNKIEIKTKEDFIQYLVQSKKESLENIKHSFERPEVQKALLELKAKKK